ncbi:Germin-like protein 9-3 [Linum grandiflorum]
MIEFQLLELQLMAPLLKLLCILMAAFFMSEMVVASDPDILSDFILPDNVTEVDSSFFTYTGARAILESDPPSSFTVTEVSMAEFPALNGQGVSFAVLQLPAGSTYPPHNHPRAAEILLVIRGCVEVGLVIGNKCLYNQRLSVGDMFVFPKGLVHFAFNGGDGVATALAAFGSASPGTVMLPDSLFASNIDDAILASSFNTNVTIIQAIKEGLQLQ